MTQQPEWDIAGLDAEGLQIGPDDQPWTHDQIGEVVTELSEQRAELAHRLAAQEIELAGRLADAGDGAGPDAADLGATTFERDQELSLVSSERDLLAQIDRSLARVAAGQLGTCEGCGGAIPKMRVLAFPRATLCVSCKQREERR